MPQRVLRMAQFGGLRLLCRHFDAKSRATAGTAFDLNGSPEKLYEMTSDGESKAGALSGLGAPALYKRVEDTRLIFGGNTGSGIIHFKNQDARRAIQRFRIGP